MKLSIKYPKYNFSAMGDSRPDIQVGGGGGAQHELYA